MRSLSRRGFLALSAGGLLAACGSGSDPEGGEGGAAGSGQDGSLALVRYFPDGIHLAGRPERMPFGVAGADGVPLSDGPSELSFVVLDDADATVAELTVARRVEGIPRAYYPVEVDLAEPGIYTLRGTGTAAGLESVFSMGAPGSIVLPGAGDRMPPFDTPTVTDPRGVDPLCTRPQACPFHARTLTEALAGGGPVAYLIGTPAHCQTGICGPVLDLLVTASADFPKVTMVHAEVFTDDDARTVAPAVRALELDFEPLLILVGADGTVQRRLDVIYDEAELRDALAGLR